MAAPKGPLQAALGREHGRLSSLGDVSRPHHHEGVTAIRSEDAASLVTATTLLGPCWVGTADHGLGFIPVPTVPPGLTGSLSEWHMCCLCG